MNKQNKTIPFNQLGRSASVEREELLAAATHVINSGWFILSAEGGAFEVEFAGDVCVPCCTSVTNGSYALALALPASGIGSGDQVATCANAAMYATLAILSVGASPVFVDVEDDHTMSVKRFAEAASFGSFKAGVVTHLYGRLAEVEKIIAVAKLHGNRDFLIGQRFAAAANLMILSDPATIIVRGRLMLLLHGDTLCTDDHAYQRFRAQARDPKWQREVLAKSYAERVALAASIRARSDTEKALKAEDIMDVSPTAVDALFREHGYIAMIHGHTHRPARHVHFVDGHECIRHVLADWHDEASYISTASMTGTQMLDDNSVAPS